jgi:hypothetical protein
MAFDDNQINASLASTIADSFNSSEDNSLNVDASATDSFNEDNSVNDNSSLDVDITDSGNTETNDTDIDVTDSFNEFTAIVDFDASDNSVNDDSVNTGVRSYNLGFDGAGLGAGSVAGDMMINNQNTVIDQSFSGNIAAEGDVDQYFGSSVVAATGDDSIAAGGDVTVDTYVNQSTNIDAEGDVLIGSEKTVSWMVNSGNEYNFDYSYTDESTTIDVADSFNEYSLDVGVTDSFNDESLVFDYTDTTIDVDAVVDSTIIDAGDIDVIL